MTAVPLHHFLVVGAVLFVLGAVGFIFRRNLILMFLSAEMMLQGVVINLVSFARFRGNLQGQSFSLFIILVAACEAALAFTLILILYRTRGSLDVNLWQDLREEGQEPTVDHEPLPLPEPEEPMPKLTPAGIEPPSRKETTRV